MILTEKEGLMLNIPMFGVQKVRQASILLTVLFLLSGCGTTAYTVEQSIDSAALAAMTSAKVVYKHACTDTTPEKVICASEATVRKTKAVRVLLWGALQSYWKSVDAYMDSENEGTSKVLAVTTAALKAIINQAKDVFSTGEVRALLRLGKTK